MTKSVFNLRVVRRWREDRQRWVYLSVDGNWMLKLSSAAAFPDAISAAVFLETNGYDDGPVAIDALTDCFVGN